MKKKSIIDYAPFDEETKDIICSILEEQFNCEIPNIDQFDKFNVKKLELDEELNYTLEFVNGATLKGSYIDMIPN